MSDRRPRLVRDPYGLLPSRSSIPPILAALGLVLVAFLTVGLLIGQLPIVSGGGGGVATPVPSGVVVDPRADVPGSLVYAKGGSIFVQSGKDVRELTSDHQDSMPAWSADGAWVYFVRTVNEYAKWPIDGSVSNYQLTYPLLMRVAAAGGQPEQLATGRYAKASYAWFFWIRQPAPDPADPNRVAIVSDGPDPVKSDTVLQLFDVAGRRFSVVKGLKEMPPLGHQDPTWRPDGRLLLYTMNDRDGATGTPSLWRYDPATGRASALTKGGYLQPSWSPDARYVAATKTTTLGTNIVVLDATDGAEVARITSDGDSFAPAWSPRGDAIAYLHVKNGIVDLRMASVAGSGPTLTVSDTIDLTTASGLDAASRPSWFIPQSELPTPAPSPSASGPGASPRSPGASGSSAVASPSPSP